MSATADRVSTHCQVIAGSLRELGQRHRAELGFADCQKLLLAAREIEAQSRELWRVRCWVLQTIGEDSLAVIGSLLDQLHGWALSDARLPGLEDPPSP